MAEEEEGKVQVQGRAKEFVDDVGLETPLCVSSPTAARVTPPNLTPPLEKVPVTANAGKAGASALLFHSRINGPISCAESRAYFETRRSITEPGPLRSCVAVNPVSPVRPRTTI